MKLYCGDSTLLDEEDEKRFSRYTWMKNSNGYVIRQIGKKVKFLHREILDCPEKYQVDHINGNPLDNRKINLRICSKIENSWNRKLNKNSKTGYKGVHFKKNNRGTKKYLARISYFGERIHLGYFYSAEDAANAYNKKAVELYGEFANLNIVKEK